MTKAIHNRAVRILSAPKPRPVSLAGTPLGHPLGLQLAGGHLGRESREEKSFRLVRTGCRGRCIPPFRGPPGRRLAGGPPDGREIKCWFPGGSSSPVLTADDLDLSYDFDTMADAGSMLGSGAIIVVDDSNSVVDVAYKLAHFYTHESCGKCTPCREGTKWTLTMVERIKDGTATPMDLDIMASVQDQIIGHCLCVLGDAMAMPVGSLIAKFRDEFEAEIEEARQRRERALMGGVLA